MKSEELIDQMVMQMVVNLVNQLHPIRYQLLEPEWEELVQGGDGERLEIE